MHFIILAIFALIPLLFDHASSRINGGCDVVVTSTSSWQCHLGSRDAKPIVCDLASGGAGGEASDNADAGAETSPLPEKQFPSFRFCMRASIDRLVDIRVFAADSGSVTSRPEFCGRQRTDDEYNSSKCDGGSDAASPMLLIWQGNGTLSRQRRDAEQQEQRRDTRLMQTSFGAPSWRGVADSRRGESTDAVIRIINKRKGAHVATGNDKEHSRARRSAQDGQQSWFLLQEVCAWQLIQDAKGNPQAYAGQEDHVADAELSGGEVCLFSLLNKLIVDVRWPTSTSPNEFPKRIYLVFNLRRPNRLQNVSDVVHNGTPGRPSPSVFTTSSYGSSAVKVTLAATLVVMTFLLGGLVCCVIRRGSRDHCCCDIRRQGSTQTGDREVAPEHTLSEKSKCSCLRKKKKRPQSQPSSDSCKHCRFNALCPCFPVNRKQPLAGNFSCCGLQSSDPGSNPAPATEHRSRNSCVICCCTKKNCRRVTRHVHSASQSTLMTSHSGLNASRSRSTSFGHSSHTSLTPQPFTGGQINNPYKSVTAAPPLSYGGRSTPLTPPRMTSTAHDRRPEYSNCIRAPLNRTFAGADNALISACNSAGHVTSHVVRNSKGAAAPPAVASGAQTILESGQLLLSSGDFEPPPTYREPPPEYSEPPGYYSVV